MTVLVDSDILIEVSRGRNQQIASRWTEFSESDNLMLYSPISASELWAGARPNEEADLIALFEALVCVPIDPAVGRKAGDFMRQHSKTDGVALADALIAACAVVSGAAIWTRNRKHYPMKEIRFFEDK